MVVVNQNTQNCPYDSIAKTLTCAEKTYKTVVIGTQIWMAENLAYMPSVNAASDSSSTVAKYYVYSYNGIVLATAKANSDYATYGVLYNYRAALAICPTGWHLPDTTEWNTLESYVGGPATADTALMSTTGWSGGITGTNAYGFSALPGGYYSETSFYNIGGTGGFWTATPDGSSYAYNRLMYSFSLFVYDYDYSQTGGFSVRCLKNQ